ncbi:transcriptional regulator [Deinococcus sp. YIM 134068]|uniref:transcriptional regulator n=1 Tax=Deinococcus lichenicola TaxID=3118910 RepID=UPI002F95ECA0
MRRFLALLALLSLSGAHADAIDDLSSALWRARTLAAKGEAEVSVLFPPRAVAAESARRADRLPVVPFRPALIRRHFTVTRADAPPLAGRDVTRFDLTPNVGQAAHWSIWVDRAWNVPLAFEERMPDGTLARRAAFTRVNAQPARRPRPVPTMPAGLRQAVLAALPGLRFPPGFTPTAVAAREAGGAEVTLSDGINVLALVIAPRNVRTAPGVASRRVGPDFVWLVGNLPDTPLRQALAGIQEVKAGELGTFLAGKDSKK